MTVALILLAVLVVTGALLWWEHRAWLRRHATPVAPSAPEAEAPREECCGMHITCERDSLLAGISDKIEYYDDEELDAYAGTAPDAYTDAQTEQFRDILLSMQPADIAGWARSLQLRGIELPAPVRDELILIVSEARAASLQHA